MGWENFELLHISTGGISILYIGNILIDRKRLMCLRSKILSGGAKVAVHLDSRAPR